MKKYLPFIFTIFCIVHFMILSIYGISFITTTFCFYVLIYYLFRWIVKTTVGKENCSVILFNLRFLFTILLLIEFSFTFVFRIFNDSTENKIGAYLSGYKSVIQTNLLYSLGILSSNRNIWEDGYIPYSNRLHQSPSGEFKYSVNYNAYGLRGKLPAIVKDSNEFRILTLGDSFVEGYGTPEDSTFPFLLEKHLNSSGKKISVINGGIGGSNPLSATKLYSNKLHELNPDLVLMEINIFDIVDYEKITHQKSLPLKEYFYAISHIYRVFYNAILFSEQISNNAYYKQINFINEIIHTLTIFQLSLNNNNQKLVVLFLPQADNLYTNSNTLFITKLSESNIPMINLQDEYKKYITNNDSSLNAYYWKKDGHHNPKGYDLMAKITAAKLTNKIIPNTIIFH